MFNYESRYTIISRIQPISMLQDMEKPSIFSKIHPVKSVFAETLSFAVQHCSSHKQGWVLEALLSWY